MGVSWLLKLPLPRFPLPPLRGGVRARPRDGLKGSSPLGIMFWNDAAGRPCVPKMERASSTCGEDKACGSEGQVGKVLLAGLLLPVVCVRSIMLGLCRVRLYIFAETKTQNGTRLFRAADGVGEMARCSDDRAASSGWPLLPASP